MPDVQRSVSTILGLLADNANGQISEQDMRDAFVTWRNGHGQIYVPASASAAITIDNNTSYFEATNPAWTLSPDQHFFDESAGNGRLTYTGVAPVVVHIACTISMSSGSNNQVTFWRLGKNSVTDIASEVHRKILTGTDVGSTALHLIQTMSTGDYLSLWVRNTTGSNNVTLEAANLQAMTMPT